MEIEMNILKQLHVWHHVHLSTILSFVVAINLVTWWMTVSYNLSFASFPFVCYTPVTLSSEVRFFVITNFLYRDHCFHFSVAIRRTFQAQKRFDNEHYFCIDLLFERFNAMVLDDNVTCVGNAIFCVICNSGIR